MENLNLAEGINKTGEERVQEADNERRVWD